MQFFTGHNFAGPSKQQGKHLDRLILDSQTSTILAQTAGGKLELESPENCYFIGAVKLGHTGTPRADRIP